MYKTKRQIAEYWQQNQGASRYVASKLREQRIFIVST